MTDSLPGSGPPPPPVAVICDRCRAAGVAGDSAFAAIPDILDFTPVPRRAHVNNWTAEHQRAFIVALAMTGSPRQAARILGRHAFGAEQLRSARGGRSFAEAWDAALEIARDREFARIHGNLSELAERTASEGAVPGQATDPGVGRSADVFGETISEDSDAERREYLEARLRIRDRLTRARRLLLAMLADDPAKRAAWEVLVGPVDWDRASRLESQADEPFANPDHEHYEGHDINPHNFTRPAMLLTAEAGLLPDVVGGHDALAPLRKSFMATDAGEAQPGEEKS